MFLKTTSSAGGSQSLYLPAHLQSLCQATASSDLETAPLDNESHILLWKHPVLKEKAAAKPPCPWCLSFASALPRCRLLSWGASPSGCCSPWLCAPDSSVFFFQGPALSHISVFWSQRCHNSLVKTTLSLGLGVRSPSQWQSSSRAGELTSYPGHSFIPPVFLLLLFFCQSDEWWLHRVTFHRCTEGPSGINES